VVSTTVSDGRTLPGGGAIEVELASRLRDYADTVSGREQLAVEAFADSLELIPRVLAENAGLDAIDLLVDLRAAHEGRRHRGRTERLLRRSREHDRGRRRRDGSRERRRRSPPPPRPRTSC